MNVKTHRFFEIIPGSLAWLTIILIFLLSWLLPTAVAIFIIIFDLYWLFKTIYLSLHLRATFLKMRENMKIDWLEKLKELNSDPNNPNYIPPVARLASGGRMTRNNPNKIREEFVDSDAFVDWDRVYHLIILPFHKEPYEVVKESISSLAESNYPKDKFIVVLGTEKSAGKDGQGIAKKIEAEFSDKFFKFLITRHPKNISNELPGKGANETWAAKQVKALVIDPLIHDDNNNDDDSHGYGHSHPLSYEDILVSVFDVDTQVPKDYFSRLTYVFLTCKHPQRSSFQPIPLFTNNIFQAPGLSRVISFSATFWQMMQQSRPERLTTFSSHSMPFKALTEIGFWNTNIVSEDSQIFWQCFLHYNGDWRAEPLFYPVYMDANLAPTFWRTMKNIYKQQRRWGWGCENIPYILNGFRRNKKISFRKKFYWGFNTIEGFHSWATNALIIFTLGWLPLIFGGAGFSLTLLSYSLPLITRWIMTLAMVGIATSAVLSVMLLPPKPKWFKTWYYIFYFLQWLLMPITLIVFGAIPGLDAQTRLFLGGKFRLGFWITPKHR